jgi:hypothetical protein
MKNLTKEEEKIMFGKRPETPYTGYWESFEPY